MTLDRDIRVTPDQITFASVALRQEVKLRSRSIERAELSKAAGNPIKAGTLDEHYRARLACVQLLETLEVARKQIGHQVRAKLELEEGR